MLSVVRTPGGAWERNPNGSRGQQLWRNRRGVRSLTLYGENRLQHFQDLTVHIPAEELGFDTGDHPRTRDRDVWYPVSENSMPGLIAALQDTVPFGVHG